ncbi:MULTISPECIES: DUF1150 family protein [Acetobacteraceae]|uniref:DUF1150 domain-containing protein n=3 Tax=Acetobacteraceae TaxID=433 RepID=A0A7U7J1J5_9PROT|nr:MULTISPECIES: DUF1150 family protein [Acetobacteraceae]MCT6814515.1 DUF1150 domain-containing protein [Bombella apis]CDG34141.1 hypothetical protein SACS_1403 [Parasaccharibacter apium]
MAGNDERGASADAGLAGDMQVRARTMTGAELRDWGMKEVAYFRTITHEGATLVAIHAADGTPVGIAEDEDSAVDAILEQDMVPTFLQ